MDRFLPRALFPGLLSLVLLGVFASAAPAGGAPRPFLANPQPEIKAAAAHAKSSDPRLKDAHKFNEGGWTYVHLEGTPEEVRQGRILRGRSWSVRTRRVKTLVL